MKTEFKNLNRINTSFSGAKIPDVSELKKIKEFTDCGLNNFSNRLIESVRGQSSSFVKTVHGIEYISDFTFKQKIINLIKNFFYIPVEIFDSVIRKYPNLKVNNSKFIQNYRKFIQLENEVNAFQGVLENAHAYMENAKKAGIKMPAFVCDKSAQCKELCGYIKDSFNQSLNKQMGSDVASYDTKKERFVTRIVSGFTAAFFLGNDFYNKAIQKGKTIKEAKQEQHLKQRQEIRENICEGIAQFTTLACFSKMVNKSIWAPAILSTFISLVSRVVSRKLSGMPIRRIKVPEKNVNNLISIENYIADIKSENINTVNKSKKSEEEKTKNSKPLLSIKNIISFCILSVAGGYALRFGKNHTKIGKEIGKLIEKHQLKINDKTMRKIIVDRSILSDLGDVLQEEKLKSDIERILRFDNGSISLGEDYRITKILGMDVKTKELHSLITAPLRFIKEVISYPYKIVSKLENTVKKTSLKTKPNKIIMASDLAQDKAGIKNIYLRYFEFRKKYPNDIEKANKEFLEYFTQMRVLSNNSKTSSSTDNSKIAVLAQTLGTLTGMWFNMNDEFNASIRTGATKYEAEKDARLRGINKFFRMTVQVIISGTLNSLFFKQYNNSVAKAGIVVAASTVLTDMASRLLSGMPNKKMTKEELEKYQKNHKEGFMSWYYKMIDKLAS